MSEHDPVGFAQELLARLASRSRHVCVFVGAGASKACGLPTVAELEEGVGKRLDGAGREKFKKQLERGNLEDALSRVRRIATLLEGSDDTVDGLSAEAARDLDARICEAIVAELGVEKADLEPMRAFATWVASCDYHAPVEVFTVNYDLLLETAFEQVGLAYFDGFVGSLAGRFRTDLVEASDPSLALPASFARLWKLHGSVAWGWSQESPAEIVRHGAPAGAGKPAAIYPSDTKYEESRRVPFVVLHDRLRRALAEPETVLLVSGYSFSDEHLNETLFEAALRRPRSEVIVFCSSQIPVALSKRAQEIANLQALGSEGAVIGSLLGEWKAPEEPHPGLWEENRFLLGDFASLARFLSATPTTDSTARALAARAPDPDHERAD